MPVRRWQSFALGALWLGFVTYAVFLSPPSAPDTLEVIRQLSTGQWATLNPGVVVLFNLMGLWPVIYACFALTDGADQATPAWPFVIGSFGFGAFALLPYLVLRKSTGALPYRSAEDALLRVLNHRLLGVGVAIATLLIVAYGLAQGHGQTVLQDFLHQFATSRFIHVMGLDFAMLTLLMPCLLWDDIARRTSAPKSAPIWRSIFLLPLLGPAIYLAFRPAVAETGAQTAAQTGAQTVAQTAAKISTGAKQ